MSNEAERMRAKIDGKLNCRHCKLFHTAGESWCHRHRYAPRNEQEVEDQFCDLFELRPSPIISGVVMNIFLDPKFK